MTKQLTESEKMRAILNTIKEAPNDIVDVNIEIGLLDEWTMEKIAKSFGGEFIIDDSPDPKDDGPFYFRGPRNVVQAFGEKMLDEMNYGGTDINDVILNIGPVDPSRKPYKRSEPEPYDAGFDDGFDDYDPAEVAHNLMTDPQELSDIWYQIEYAISARPEGDPYDAIAHLARKYDLPQDLWTEVADHAADKAAGYGTVMGYWEELHREFGLK